MVRTKDLIDNPESIKKEVNQIKQKNKKKEEESNKKDKITGKEVKETVETDNIRLKKLEKKMQTKMLLVMDGMQ